MVIAKQGLAPKDGYWFEEMDKSVQRGRGWEEVTRKVIRYRKTNKFPLGHPMTEVLEQAQRRWPDGFWEKRIRGE